MKEEEVRAVLHQVAEQEVSESVNLWPAIQARMQRPWDRFRWTWLVPTTRLGWVFAALTLFLAVSTVAYAMAPIVNQLFRQDVGLSHVEQAGLSQEIDRSQTIDGVTVTLEQGYADANRIVVGFTLGSSDGQRYEPHATLSDGQGTVFPQTTGLGLTGQSDVVGISLPPGEGSYVLSFDASGLRDTPATVDLHLEVMLREFVVPAAEPTLSLAQDELPEAPVDSMVVEVSPLPMEGKLVGPFAFDFDLPFNPGHVIMMEQIVEAAGVPLEVRHVVVTPSESRALLCIEPPDGEWEQWAAVATLSTGAGQAGVAWSTNPKEGCVVHSFLPSLYGQEGDWTLTVDELIRFFDVPGKDQTRLSGPWVFRFQVP
jgi:hypothetical protein